MVIEVEMGGRSMPQTEKDRKKKTTLTASSPCSEKCYMQ
jgi:hypothetical protein